MNNFAMTVTFSSPDMPETFLFDRLKEAKSFLNEYSQKVLQLYNDKGYSCILNITGDGMYAKIIAFVKDYEFTTEFHLSEVKH